MNELENKLLTYLDNKVYLTDISIYKNDTGHIIIEITVDGDWKHDHLLLTNEVLNFLSDQGYKVITYYEGEEVTDGDDSYESTHFFEAIYAL